MLSNEIRAKFLEFFKSKGHEVVPSDSLVPKGDPTLLFTGAGMNQFKEQFLGANVSYKRASSSQKCLRTADLDKVGKTPSHHTFFEMLGNFSFGDYFKKDAIVWGWEFLTGSLGIKKARLWVSVYKDDNESFLIWRDIVKVPEERIVKLGARDNFWPSDAPKDGPNGPCGPCSEIFFDRGRTVGCEKDRCGPACDCGRFVEIWNLVFTQFDRKAGGQLDPLPHKNIDTGMGLERITAVMQGVKTNFETDLFAPIIDEIKLSNPKLKSDKLNAIADHIRAATFAICDGVAPSNEERGYVIRKLIRRAYLYSGAKSAFLYNIVPKIVEIMKEAYPRLQSKREEISLIVKEEEERFASTLAVAMPILEDDIEAAGSGLLKGDKIFKLVDTYGLPLEIIEERAKKVKIRLDKDAFLELMESRKELSRKSSKIDGDIFALNLFTKGPDTPRSSAMPLKAKIAYIVKGKKSVTSVSSGDVAEVMTDPQGESFYAEAGGQVGDTGMMEAGNSSLQILNTVKVSNKMIHVVKVLKGSIKTGDTVMLDIHGARKSSVAKNHTATHLLHSALRQVLGEHVHQAGSLVEEKRLRFDFTHMKKMTDSQIDLVEASVNEQIKKGIAVNKELKSLNDAKKAGAMALFGEKYTGSVTVVSVEGYSKEVCGGTHVDNTKEIGLFKITRESSVASGIRRIEALTGASAAGWIEEMKRKEEEIESARKKKEEEKEREREKLKDVVSDIDAMVKRAQDIRGVKIIIENIKNANMGILRSLADKIRSLEKSSFVMLAGVDREKVSIVLAFTKDLVSNGADASKAIKPMAEMVKGSGGGRADFAQAGGKDPSKLNKVFEIAKATATDIIGGT
ncbi:MAG: alanine--tRNA ligase [Candidatus Omnitrophota bacterium]